MMSHEVQTSQPSEVLSAVLRVWGEMFPNESSKIIQDGFTRVLDSFAGRYRDYHAIDASYHDLEHTMQGTLCMARLLLGRFRAKAEPVVDQRMFGLGILAILLHDTGYLKQGDDVEGTGAKYTLTHVQRSMDFAAVQLGENSFDERDIRAVQNMIRCTGVNVDINAIQFQEEAERICGLALGTADLIGQMAASDYVDKLPVLFSEFEECARYSEGKMGAGMVFASAADLKNRTPGFWEKYVLPKAENDFRGLFRFLTEPESGRNRYLERVEANIARIRGEGQLQTA